MDWVIFGKTSKMFSDEILETAIEMFPKRNVETPSKLFMHLCKEASKRIKAKPSSKLPSITKELK